MPLQIFLVVLLFAASSTGTVPIRLNGANIQYGGRVEVFYRGQWGKICRKEWSIDDVKVICKQLGFKGALAEFIGSDVKNEKLPFLMSNVSCTGSESELASCKRSDGEYDCSDNKGAQALCEPKNIYTVLEKKVNLVMDIGSSEEVKCSLKNKTKWIRYDSTSRELNSTSGGRIQVSGDTLTVKSVQLSDGGTYQCQALTYARFYTIYVNAEFIMVKSQQTLINGTSGIISCSAQGNPTPQFGEWSRVDGKQLEKDRFKQLSNGSIHVSPVRPEDKGKYKFTIKQTEGTDRVTIKHQVIDVSVFVHPAIQLRRRASQSNRPTQEGDMVNLTCTISEGSWPLPEIHWLKDDTTLIGKTNTTLSLTNVSAEDVGRYTCKATNPAGSAEDTIYVTVDIPPKVNPELKNQSVPLNSSFIMECYVKGNPLPKANWTKNGKHLANTSNTITINRVTFDNAGQYGCYAENRAGSINAAFWIDVTVFPEVYVSPRSQSVPEGKTTNISCKATAGVPKPTLSWKFHGGDLPLLAIIIIVNNTEEESLLQLPNITKDMEGTYQCTATNKASTATSNATLLVLGKPTAQITPKSYPPLVIGDKLTLTCQVSETTTEVKWKKNGTSVIPREGSDISKKDNKSYVLVIENVESGDAGDYSCEAHNQAGVMSSSVVEIRVRDGKNWGKTVPAVQTSGTVFPLTDLPSAALAPPSGTILKWYYIVAPLAAVIFLTFVGWYICIKRRMTAANAKSLHHEHVHVHVSPDEEQGYELEALNVEVDEWEISRGRITFKEVVGSGAFGSVWRANLSPPDGKPGKQIVGAKCFTPTSGREGRKALMREIGLGKLLGDSPQPNIITFLGCVTAQIHPILIMEYLPHGDLLGYLRKCRGIVDRYYLGEGEAVELKTYDLVLFAKQIATGMVYLGARGIIHRDLAARNVLLDRNFNCKVTDFGLAYQNFKYGHGNAKKGCIPVKWTAPEILFGNLAGLTTQSDVWSYGIVLYEIFTIGGIPYPDWSEGRTIAEIKDGYRMPKPEHIDDTLHNLMARCWHLDPDFRPRFENLRQRMQGYIEKRMYLELLNMSQYNAAKYSKVEDNGAQGNEGLGAQGNENLGTQGNENLGAQGNEGLGAQGNEEPAAAVNVPNRNQKPIPPPRRKWASVRS